MIQHSLKDMLSRVSAEVTTLAGTSRVLDCNMGRLAHGELSQDDERAVLQSVDLLRQTLRDLSIVLTAMDKSIDVHSDFAITADLSDLHLSSLKHRLQGNIAPTCPEQGEHGDVHLF